MDNTQPSGTGDTNLFGMSDNLEEFLKTWAEDEVDPQETAKMLHSPDGAQYQGWLPQELLTSFQNGSLSTAFLSMECNRTFASQTEIGDWLDSVWQLWFDQPFPGQQPALPSVQQDANAQHGDQRPSA